MEQGTCFLDEEERERLKKSKKRYKEILKEEWHLSAEEAKPEKYNYIIDFHHHFIIMGLVE